MKGILRKWFLFILLLNSELCITQELGIPFVSSYTRDEYGHGTQNWDVVQSPDGKIFFANNEGLMEFDGSSFNSYPQPNRTILRSLLIQDNNIYAGGQNEFGVYHLDRETKWRYTSLKDKIPASHQNFEDVWTIVSQNDKIFFNASDKIFILNGKNCRVLDQNFYKFLGKAGNTIFVQDRDGTLYQLQDDVTIILKGSEFLHNTEIRDVLYIQGEYLIATYKNGLFKYDGKSIQKWQNEGESYFADQYINALDLLHNGNIVIGTGFNGIVIIDPKGKFKYKISKNDGLPSDRINCTFVDKHKNLWVGLENGLAMIQTNSPFSRILPGGNIEEAGYDVAITEDKLYFGTNNGLFYLNRTNLIDNEFKLVKNSNGQVYGIDIIDEQIFLSHHEGGFIVNDDIATRFYDQTGVWSFNKSTDDTELILSGTYDGISVFNKNSFELQYQIPGLNVSSRFIEQDNNDSYWMSHPYLGIYRIRTPFSSTSRKIEILDEVYGLPSKLQNHIFKINDVLLLCTKNGIYSWDENTNKYIFNDAWNDQLDPSVKVRRLFEGQNNDIWFITEKEVGVIKIEENGLKRELNKQVFPRLKKLMNDGWEKIIPYDGNNVIMTSTHGFIHFNSEQIIENNSSFDIVLNEMYINKDSIIFPTSNNSKLVLDPFQNTFVFNVGATDFVDNDELRFQYMLEGFDDDWTPHSLLRTKEYNNIAPGQYKLQIRAMNTNGQYSSTFNLKIKINSPWYKSLIAKCFYSLLLLSVIFFTYASVRKKYNVLEEIIDTTVIRSKEEILQLETQKIKAALDHKNRELVSATLHLVQKNDSLSEIASILQKIKKESSEATINRKLQKLINTLKTDESLDQGWDQVMYHFNEVHKGFFDRLKINYPSITPKDQKMCAYLKMNLTSKEISTLMNVSLRGVEASRYRLRRKLELNPNINLNEFLMNF